MSTDYVIIDSPNAEMSVVEQSTKFTFMLCWDRVKGNTFENVGDLPFELTEDQLVQFALNLLKIASYQENVLATALLKKAGTITIETPIVLNDI